MKWQVVRDSAAVARAAAKRVLRVVEEHPDAVLCLATGATPQGLYELLVRERQRRPGLFALVRVVKLDEWYGLGMDDPATCEYFLQERVVRPLGIAPWRYLAFQSDAPDGAKECERVERALDRWGGIDVAILGLGINGHLGLNEPAAELTERAHVAQLTRETRGHAMLKETGKRPTRGLTLGMGQLMRAREVLLMVSGEKKREPLARVRNSGISTRAPASLLKLHRNAIAICDRDSSK